MPPESPPEHRIAYPNVTVGAALAGDQVFSADAVVVGSGAGGATVAARLRDAGLDVLLLEEGALHRTETFTTDPATMIRRLYRDAGTSMILGRPPILFAEGRCVGGSTVINGGMSWRTPEPVLTQWEHDFGLPDTGVRAMEPYFEQAERILHVETNDDDTLGRNSHLFLEGARKLGWPVKRNPRNMRRCVGLNNCALGCPTGAKQAMHVTEIPRALAAGAHLVTHARVDRVLFRGSRAVGVRGRLVGDDGRPGPRFRAHGRLVVLAAGARHTPGIMKRSWLRARPIGRGLHTHPNAKVVGIFDEPIAPWVGTHQAFHIHHFLAEGVLIGYATVPPGLLAAGLPGLGPEHAEKMRLYNHMLTAAALIEDEGEGRVVLGPDRQPYLVSGLSAADVERIHHGVALTAELVFAAGARRVLLPFADLPSIDGPDEIERIRRRPRAPKAIELMTVHIMGTARMATDPGRGATDARGAVHGIDGLVVADASVLPSSIGVNPQETIIAMALRNADRDARRQPAGGRRLTRMPLFSRPDATPATVHPVRRIMPFLMPTRNEAFVLFEQHVDAAPAARFLAARNAARPPERAITLFHLVLRAIGVAFGEFPRLNRFVAGSRLYERRGIWLAFSAKQRLERDAPLFTAKVPFEPAESLDTMVDRIYDALREGRSGRETHTEREVKAFLRLPAPVLRLAVRAVRRLDAWGLLPGSFSRDDPLYASAFVANLGSVGLEAAYHHLYEYGTIPIFVTIGRLHRRPVVLDDGTVASREVFTLRYTYDERIEDGFYAARALERLQARLESPSELG
jgi:choline dehydrogenase-like flavoprotein